MINLEFKRSRNGYQAGGYFIYQSEQETVNGRHKGWNVEFKGERIFRETRKWEAVNVANNHANGEV